METKKITIYDHREEGSSMDIKQQQKLKKQGKRPLGLAKVFFDEAIGDDIYYTIDRIIYYDSVRITVIDRFMRCNYCVYRINEDHKLIYDPIASTHNVLDNANITDIRFYNEKDGTEYIFYNGKKYEGRI